MDSQTKQIVYIMLACLCVWIVLSEFVGNKYITSALSSLFPALVK